MTEKEWTTPRVPIAGDNLRHLGTRRQMLAQWRELVEEFLPVTEPDSKWRYAREAGHGDPPQGWKLHVSATILNAVEVFRRSAPYLRAQNLLFKSVVDLDMLNQLNTGLRYGFSQIGKFITVYPPTPETALRVAAGLDALTADFPAPPVPYDLPYRPGSAVYYRYGAFHRLEIEDGDGQRVPAIQNPAGEFVPDRREPGHAVPEWVTDNPFPIYEETPDPASPLRTEVLTYELLAQRGKGGVYRAVDIGARPPRRCIVKEGRRHGEITWDNRDGRYLIEREETILRELAAAGVPVPEVLKAFDLQGHRYLVLAHVEGENLAIRLGHKRRKLPLPVALGYARRIAEQMAAIHAAGWVWRDCKPLNLILTPAGDLRPLDFEGAVPIDTPSALPYGTPAYAPPEIFRAYDPSLTAPVYFPKTNLAEDLHALGATLYHVLTSYLPRVMDKPMEFEITHVKIPPLGRARKGVPEAVRRLVAELLDPDPEKRPSAAEAAARLAPYAGTALTPLDALPPLPKPRRQKDKNLILPDALPGAPQQVVQGHRPQLEAVT